ncbi:hypothetical protein [Sphingomonas kyeonggiensis]|jgi:hypothetical protein|uniref:DUF3304 domain-containing protein n=1 Tax=Sphingomonas kyeonggiensis TaxID=1268553 RepID=A0A7W6JSL8_9SPHN|nr:hypothetical protein [Sphingomonas kyeonggiensis]MBB4098745.1 hypothetical protein [Sphingomonas kyeonggiensis]
MKKQIATAFAVVAMMLAPAAWAQYRYFGNIVPDPDPSKVVEYIITYTDGNIDGVVGRHIVYCGGDEDFGGQITMWMEYQQVGICEPPYYDPENP